MTLESYYDFRRNLADSLERELIGPFKADETLNEPPATRYVAAILFPDPNEVVEGDQDDEVADESDDGFGGADPGIAKAHIRYPSSMGLTLAVDTHTAKSVTFLAEAATYRPTLAKDAEGAQNNGVSEQWQRQMLTIEPTVIDVAQSGDHSWRIAPGLELFVRVRPTSSKGIASVTASLRNRISPPKGKMRDAYAFFQVGLRAEANGSAFVDRPRRKDEHTDKEIERNRLLFRHAPAIAVGHGCSVDWTPSQDDPTRATAVFAQFIPRAEILAAESNPEIRRDGLRMKFLASSDRTTVLGRLDEFVAAYERWIATQSADPLHKVPAALADTAAKNLQTCAEAAQRMRNGIRALSTDDNSWRAFQAANLALLKSRARAEWRRKGYPAGGPQEDDSHIWWPFQIGFVLTCIPGIVASDRTDGSQASERDIADVLWFPTGGGKTEAYLCLIAFTAFYRRLEHEAPKAAGVAVIMRYTLRLLTAQQFERAASLICACESIRRARGDFGAAPISIGLWVGGGGAPNTLQQARAALDKLRAGRSLAPDEGTPIQLQSCPWCGAKLGPNNYYISTTNPSLVVACGNQHCEFSGGLPVQVVDEDIYRKPPTVLLATSDKFAGLPWKPEIAKLLGGPTGAEPPDLIVQDELHLISGPLGTLAGLYETAIDLLCAHFGRAPKVIASTATIRRATSQVRQLFDRESRQFPPPGLDARDSYFAVQAPAARKASRLFMGVLSPHLSHTTVMVRCYAALLQLAKSLPGDDAARDPYWTLVGYFNSLRVLGGARMQVQDDVAEGRIPTVARSLGAEVRLIDERIELTSREPSADIPGHLNRMAASIPSAQALDVILATNMISVGVDIDRLGLMVMMGQPPSTAEYIQATSRVGRQFPALVVALYNSAKSRDRSYYERFRDYHSALYRDVESTSVTPFSARARDRALHAVLIALARMTIPELEPNDGASRVQQCLPQLMSLANEIVNRVGQIHRLDGDRSEVDKTKAQLEGIIDRWCRRADDVGSLKYSDPSHADQALLLDPTDTNLSDDHFPTMWSLRDVDATCELYQVT